MNDNEPKKSPTESDSRPTKHLSRRGVITAAAWSVPVIALSSALPAAAASGGLHSTTNTGPGNKVMAKGTTLSGLTFKELDASNTPIASNGSITVTATGNPHITIPSAITLVNGIATFDVTADNTCAPGDTATFMWTCTDGGTPSTVSFTVTIGDDTNPAGGRIGAYTSDSALVINQWFGPVQVLDFTTADGLPFNGQLKFFYWDGSNISYSLATDQWGSGEVDNGSKMVQFVNGRGNIYVRCNQPTAGTQFAWGYNSGGIDVALVVWNAKAGA
jgi:hypothetical protein